MAELDEILADRGKEYGEFKNQAQISQMLKYDMRGIKWFDLKSYQRESLEMIVHKIARIVNGNPNNIDSWDDIAGYAKLVSDRLKSDELE